MNIEELKATFKAQGWVIWNGRKHFLHGIMSEWDKGRIRTSAIIEDADAHERVTYQVKLSDITRA